MAGEEELAKAGSRRFFRSSSGQALVEYAIVFPLQLLFMLIIIQLAHLFIAKQVLEYAAFCGARAAMVYEADPTLPDYTQEVSVRRAAAIPISLIAGNTDKRQAQGIIADDTHAHKTVVPGWYGLRMSQEAYRLMRGGAAAEDRGALDNWRAEAGGRAGTEKPLPNSGAAWDKTVPPEGWDKLLTVAEIGTFVSSDPENPGTKCTLHHHYELRIPVANRVIFDVIEWVNGDEDWVRRAQELTDEYGVPHIPLRATSVLARPW